jgi:hypothetical protein
VENDVYMPTSQLPHAGVATVPGQSPRAHDDSFGRVEAGRIAGAGAS